MITTTLLHGDCRTILPTLPPNSIDAIVTDPPYGLSFMGKRWDYDVPSSEIWAECLRVLKPGGHLLAFAGTRTQHRMAVRIEDAGFEIRDMIAWVYGSGFPKSLDVSKAIDKAAGAERGTAYVAHGGNQVFGEGKGKAAGVDRTPGANLSDPPVTDAALQWSGWGTALKPAIEPITVARKPLIGTVAENVLTHGTGALNIDGCRVGTDEVITATRNVALGSSSSGVYGAADKPGVYVQQPGGRWPANLIHDGSQLVMDLFPSDRKTGKGGGSGMEFHGGEGDADTQRGYGYSGSAARFFYCAKASKADRDADNKHPTVKPTALMRYLCRLVTPPSGTVLDPFMGSGSTGKAAILENFHFIGIEREAEYIEIAKARIEKAQNDG